jgi:hypothetical protein
MIRRARVQQLVVACVCMGIATGAPSADECRKRVEGGAFLEAGRRRGVSPSSDCQRVSLADNEFHAWPTRDCSIIFDARSWLSQGYVFEEMHGNGDFQTVLEPTQIKVTVVKGRGFRMGELIARRLGCQH